MKQRVCMKSVAFIVALVTIGCDEKESRLAMGSSAGQPEAGAGAATTEESSGGVSTARPQGPAAGVAAGAAASSASAGQTSTDLESSGVTAAEQDAGGVSTENPQAPAAGVSAEASAGRRSGGRAAPSAASGGAPDIGDSDVGSMAPLGGTMADMVDSPIGGTNVVQVPMDEQAPQWPQGAAMYAERIDPREIQLAWSHAVDNVEVTTYVLYQDEAIIARLPAQQSMYIASGLLVGAHYSFGVVAEDAAGNRSDKMTLVLSTADAEPPVWTDNAVLRAVDITETTAMLSWPPAQDNVAVARYRILLNGRIVLETAETTAPLQQLMPLTQYEAEVIAIDGSGNRSANPPTTQFTTIDTTPPQFASGAVLALYDATPRQVRITWQAAIDNGTVAGYEVYLDGAQLGRTDANTRTFTVQGLQAGSQVTVSVKAFDRADNMSVTGPSATFDTGDDTPPTWPANPSIVASDITDSSLTLAWTPATDDVAVSAYTVTRNGQVIGESAQPQMTINQLSPWSEYTFTVRARDALGNSTDTVLSTQAQTLDLVEPNWQPGALLNALNVTSTGLKLTWPAAEDDVSVVAYEIFQDGFLLGQVNGETTEFGVLQLTPWTEYDFRVTAIDQAGNRASMSLQLTQRTADEGSPTWPNGALTATNVTPSSVTLTWPAAQDDVAITAYVIAQNGMEIARTDGSTLTLDVNGLSPWTEYTFTVTSEDEAGNASVQALTVTQKTPDTVSPTFSAGAGLSIADLTSTSATVRWPKATDDVAVTRYEVAIDGGPKPAVDGQTTELSLDALRPMRTYLITVRAYDEANNPSLELSTSITTPDGGPPSWAGKKLTATAGITEVQLSWDAAIDDVAVTGYRLYQGQVLIYEGVERQWLVEGLTAESQYTFSVQAQDGAGNWSVDGPTASVTTAKGYDPGFQRLTKAQFLNTITDVYWYLWEDMCRHPKRAQDCGDPNHAFYRGRDIFYRGTLSDIGIHGAATFPSDEAVPPAGASGRGFSRFDARVYGGNVIAWTKSSLAASQGWRDWVASGYTWQNCSLGGYDAFSTYEACAADFIEKVGRLAYRRPLTPAESTYYLDMYRNGEAIHRGQARDNINLFAWALHDVIATMTLSPQFLYRVEVGDENGRLTAYELASRLSYHFWNTMPDVELLDAAEDGSLLTPNGYQAQVERLFNDPKSTRAIDEFWGDFFVISDIPSVAVHRQDGAGGWQVVRYHTGEDMSVDLKDLYPIEGQAEGVEYAMRGELLNLGRWFSWMRPGTFEDLFRSNLHFMTCPEDGECSGAGPWSQYSYGIDGSCTDYTDCRVRAWNGTGQGWNGVDDPFMLPEPERAGLITRMSMLAHDTIQARPIRRGLKIRELLLCDPVPPPENCDVVKPPSVTGICESAMGPTGVSCSDDQHCSAGETCVGWDREVNLSVREKVEILTEEPGTSCAGCHSTLINGFGHALGHFSSVGKYWEADHLFSTRKDGNGRFMKDMRPKDQFAPIDTTGSTIMNGQVVEFDGPHEVADILVDSGQMEWCFAREYFRFTMGRAEWDSDADTIETIAQSMRDGATLADAFKAIVYTPQFKSLYKAPVAAPQGGQP